MNSKPVFIIISIVFISLFSFQVYGADCPDEITIQNFAVQFFNSKMKVLDDHYLVRTKIEAYGTNPDYCPVKMRFTHAYKADSEDRMVEFKFYKDDYGKWLWKSNY